MFPTDKNKFINVKNLEPIKEAERLLTVFRWYEGPDYDIPSIFTSRIWDIYWDQDEEECIITDASIENYPELMQAFELYKIDVLFHGKDIAYSSDHWWPAGDEVCIYKGPDVREYERINGYNHS